MSPNEMSPKDQKHHYTMSLKKWKDIIHMPLFFHIKSIAKTTKERTGGT